MGAGILSGDDKQLQFSLGDHLVASLDRPELLFINLRGIRFRGFEHTGYEKDGRKNSVTWNGGVYLRRPTRELPCYSATCYNLQ